MRIREINNDLPIYIDELTLSLNNEIINDEKNKQCFAASKIHSRHRSFHHKLTTV